MKYLHNKVSIIHQPITKCIEISKELVSHLLYNIPHIFNNPFPGGSVVKNLSNKARDASSIPGQGRSSGEGSGNPLQCSCLGNPMNRGAWQATFQGVAKESDTTQGLNNNKYSATNSGISGQHLIEGVSDYKNNTFILENW